MNLLKIIRDVDVGFDAQIPSNYEKRKAARAIVFDGDKKIALLNVTRKNYHKLSGGGIEAGEDIETALRREVMEEIGCSIQNVKELGIIEEYRNNLQIHQISYCYTANVVGEKGLPNFIGDEIDDGLQPEWMSLDDAIKKLESEIGVKDYEGKFIRMRDLIFLKETAKLKHQNL